VKGIRHTVTIIRHTVTIIRHTVTIIRHSIYVYLADVDGSLEAITSCLETYDCDLCTLETVSSGVGVVTENDVELARDFNGMSVYMLYII